MQYMALFLFIFLSINTIANENTQRLSKINLLTKFAFGSCNREYLPQPLWPLIIADKPQLFIWGGDNIYGDKNPFKHQIEKKYRIQNKKPGYQKLKQVTPIIGIWDDHDYGKNNGGGEYKKKEVNRHFLLDFLEVEKDAPVRSRDGVYQSFVFGPTGKQVKIILLDPRYNQTKGDFLGTRQWSWLGDELESSEAQIHFIMTGLPFLTPDLIRSEEWANKPKQQEKLISLIKKYQTPGVVFLSGDKHFGAIIERHGFLEIMSSGMTHTPFILYHPFLHYYFPKALIKRNYGLISINWESSPISLKVSLKGPLGELLEQTFTLNKNSFR